MNVITIFVRSRKWLLPDSVKYGISGCNEELELLGYFLANVLQHSYGSRGFVFQNVLCYN